MILPWFQWTTISLGPLTIQVWGLFVSLGMVTTFFILSKRHGAQSPQILFDQGIVMIIAGLFFSRVFHVAFYEPGFYVANPAEILKVWHGGFSSFGGLFGAVLGFLTYTRYKKLPLTNYQLLSTADIFSFAALYGWMVGRIGCVMIHDHLGKLCNCPLSILTADGPRLDMTLLEILGLIPLAVWFYLVRNKPKQRGWFTAVFFVYCGILRFILDFLRATDIPGADTRYLGLTPGQYSAILLVLVGAFLLRKKKIGEVA